MTHLDAQALQRLLNAHGAALRLYAGQWCHAPDDALQEALLELLRQEPVPCNPVGWLYTTVRRRAMNVARAESRRAKHQRQAGRLREPWFSPADAGGDNHLDYESLLCRLPQLEREIVVTRIWGELSFKQIADLVQRPLSTVHRRYQQALDALERMINEHESTARQNDASRSRLS